MLVCLISTMQSKNSVSCKLILVCHNHYHTNKYWSVKRKCKVCHNQYNAIQKLLCHNQYHANKYWSDIFSKMQTNTCLPLSLLCKQKLVSNYQYQYHTKKLVCHYQYYANKYWSAIIIFMQTKTGLPFWVLCNQILVCYYQYHAHKCWSAIMSSIMRPDPNKNGRISGPSMDSDCSKVRHIKSNKK